MQKRNGSAAIRGAAAYLIPNDLKVVCPILSAGMEQSDELPGIRISRANIARLPPIAEQTRECQVAQIGRTAMLDCNDVVDLMPRGRIRFVN